MESLKKYLQSKGYSPRISFKDGQAHVVELIDAKQETIKTADGEVKGWKFDVVEGGDSKTFFTSSEALLVALAPYKEHSIVKIQMTRKSINGVVRSRYIVEEVSGHDEAHDNFDDIPIVGDNETNKEDEEPFDIPPEEEDIADQSW
jgi:hypothetical protein